MKVLIPAILAVMAATQPAAAFERMLRSDCQESFTRVANLMPSFEPARDLFLSDVVQSFRVTPSGWCQFDAAANLDEAEFDLVEWRMDGTKRWTRDGIAPFALQLRITGLRPDQMQASVATNRPPVELDVTLRQLPDAGVVIVERAVMENTAGDSLSISGVFERVFLTSPAMMQVSMGSATFKAGLMALTLEGTYENPFGFNGSVEITGNPEDRFEGVFETISSLPDGVIDDASRAELTAFATDLPKPIGTLEVAVESERGLGIMQVVMSAYSAVDSLISEDEASLSNEMEILFHGLTVSADWSPAAQNAD